MTDVVPPEAVDTYLQLALAGEQRRATRYVVDLLHDATPPTALITDLLAPAQREIGERWHRGDLSTADEHLVTSITSSSLAAMGAGSSCPEPRGLVLVVCAEDDWHSLASLMFAELLRHAGRRVLHLGPSAPSADVSVFIARHRPEAVAVTCNLCLAYLGTSRVADAAHAHGVPVLAGGRALDLQRALRLGADGWAQDSTSAVRVLDQWRARTPVVDPRPVQHDPAALALGRSAADLGGRAFEELGQLRSSVLGRDRHWLSTLRSDLADTVRCLAAARLVDDPEVCVEYREWLRQLYAARGVPEQVLEVGSRALRPLVAEVDVAAADLLVSR